MISESEMCLVGCPFFANEVPFTFVRRESGGKAIRAPTSAGAIAATVRCGGFGARRPTNHRKRSVARPSPPLLFFSSLFPCACILPVCRRGTDMVHYEAYLFPGVNWGHRPGAHALCRNILRSSVREKSNKRRTVVCYSGTIKRTVMRPPRRRWITTFPGYCFFFFLR